MAFTDRLTVVIDFVTGPAQAGLGKLRSEVKQAEGAMGKFKAGAGALGGALQQHIAGAAVAAGSALVTFGVKSVQAFQNTALAAGKFADATGTSVEAASRLIEVAGDLGIQSDAVQSAIMRMNVAIDKNTPALKGMTDSIVRAKDGSVDTAATFQNLVTRIGSIRDATERARVAQEVFGRGYGEMAELMTMSADELAASLAAVSDQQVIDDSERKKAERFRESLDDLQDKVNGLMMDLGEELVPVLSDVADSLVSIADFGRDVSDVFEGIAGSGLVDFFSPLDNIASGLNKVFGENVPIIDRFKGGIEAIAGSFPGIGEAVSDWAGSTEEVNDLIEYGTELGNEIARIYGERIPPAVEESNVAVFKFRDATADAEAKARDLESQWAYLFGTLDSEKALLDLQQQFDDLYEAGVTAYAAGVEGADNAVEAQQRHKQAIIDTKIEVAKYAMEVLGLPPDAVTKILAEIDAGNLDAVERRLNILSRNRTISLDIIAKGGAGWMMPINGRKAKGGPVEANKTYLVGEEGEELFVPSQPGMIVPNNKLGSVGASATSAAPAAPMVVNITTGADPEDVVRAIERYKRRNGSLPF